MSAIVSGSICPGRITNITNARPQWIEDPFRSRACPGLLFMPVAAPSRAELKGLVPTLAERIGHSITYRIATLVRSNTVAIGRWKLPSGNSPLREPEASSCERRFPLRQQVVPDPEASTRHTFS